MVKKLATSSVFLALSVVALIIGSIFPVRIAMLFLASLLTCVVVLECGPKYAWLTFIGTGLLAFLLIPKKSVVYIYILFLGYYPIIKLYIERLDRILHEWIVKILAFNLVLVLAYFGFKTFLIPSLDNELLRLFFKYLAYIIASLEVLFVAYDIAFSMAISFYVKRIYGFLKK